MDTALEYLIEQRNYHRKKLEECNKMIEELLKNKNHE